MNKTYLTTEEVAKLENAATNTRDRLLIRILFHLGIRVTEAIALTVDDIDLVNGKVVIQHLKKRVTANCPNCGARLAKAHTYCPGCGNEIGIAVKKAIDQPKIRTLPIDEETLEMIEHFIRRGGPVYKNGQQRLFGINRHRAWQIIHQCAEKAGGGDLVNPSTGVKRGVSPHRLRDAFAVHAIKNDDSGDGLIMLQEHLGHASFNTTARYRKIAGEEHRQWYGRLWREEKDSG